MNVSISEGNSKLGHVPNVSLPPITSCSESVPCTKDCYAKKFMHYPNVKKAWTNNFEILKNNREKYFQDIINYLDKNKPHFFRYHVAGDIQDQNYVDNMVEIAKQFPETIFLAFTKMYDLDYSQISENLSIVFSAWPNWPLPKQGPIAYMQDGTEKRYNPDKTIRCPGVCDTCGLCFELKRFGLNVVFHKH